MTDVICVIDAGTVSVRCGLVDQDGAVIVQRQVELSVERPRPGFAEQSADGIWRASVSAVRAAIDQRPDARIAAVTVSAQRASIAGIASDGSPVTPFLLWMDQRGEQTLDELARRVGAAVFTRRSGLPFGAMPAVTRVLWIRKEQPDAYARVARFVGVQDWITTQLTETLTPTDASCAGWTGMFDPAASQWCEDVLDALGIPLSMLPPVCSASDTVGTVSPTSAAALGIPAETPVHAGGGDQQCSSVGAGAIVPGSASLNLGTSATYVAPALPGSSVATGFIRSGHVIPALEDREATIPSCGSAIDWLAEMLGYGADRQGYERMMREAGDAPVGSDGLVFVPALAGLGTPTWSGGGGWVRGLALAHSRGQLVRSALEGIALQFRDVLAKLDVHAGRPGTVSLVGGAARSDVFCQLLADVARTPTLRAEGDPQHAALRGAAACSWVGLGDSSSFDQAIRKLAGRFREFVPDAQSEADYARLFQSYLLDVSSR